jgi:hypothetical protein
VSRDDAQHDERTFMKRLWRTWVGVTALAVLGLVGATVAAGAGSSKGSATTATTTTTTTSGQPSLTPERCQGRGANGETPLTGDVAAKAKAAAVAKVGGTADEATTENDSSNANAAYEVHVTKADGTHVKVILDKSFDVLEVETGGPGHGPPGEGFGFRHR